MGAMVDEQECRDNGREEEQQIPRGIGSPRMRSILLHSTLPFSARAKTSRNGKVSSM